MGLNPVKEPLGDVSREHRLQLTDIVKSPEGGEEANNGLDSVMPTDKTPSRQGGTHDLCAPLFHNHVSNFCPLNLLKVMEGRASIRYKASSNSVEDQELWTGPLSPPSTS